MTLNMIVCPHDTANNPDRWYLFVQYLVQTLGIPINLNLSLDFADFHDQMKTADIAYANPSDTIVFLEQHGFVAVARPSNKHDEVVFVSNHDVPAPSLQSLQGVPIASVENLLPTKIALHILESQGIKPSSVHNCESWTSVIGCIWRGEFNYGVIYKDTYDELSEQGKGMVKVFATSDERVAFHNILIGRNAQAMKAEIEQAFLAMHTSDKGKSVLTELAIAQWLPTSADDIARIKHIMESY